MPVVLNVTRLWDSWVWQILQIRFDIRNVCLLALHFAHEKYRLQSDKE